MDPSRAMMRGDHSNVPNLERVLRMRARLTGMDADNEIDIMDEAGGIYAIIGPKKGNIYVGMTTNSIAQRYMAHLEAARRIHQQGGRTEGRDEQAKSLYKKMNVYGPTKFRIVALRSNNRHDLSKQNRNYAARRRMMAPYKYKPVNTWENRFMDRLNTGSYQGLNCTNAGATYRPTSSQRRRRKRLREQRKRSSAMLARRLGRIQRQRQVLDEQQQQRRQPVADGRTYGSRDGERAVKYWLGQLARGKPITLRRHKTGTGLEHAGPDHVPPAGGGTHGATD